MNTPTRLKISSTPSKTFYIFLLQRMNTNSSLVIAAFFNQYKKQLKRQPSAMHTIIVEQHQASIHCVSEESVRNTFAHCGYPEVERNEIEGVLVEVLMSTGVLKTI